MRSKLTIGGRALVVSALMLAPLLATHDQSSAVVIGSKLYIYTYAWNSSTNSSENKLWVYEGSSSATILKDFGSASIGGIYELGTTVAILVYESSSYKFYVYDPSTQEIIEKGSLSSYPNYVTEFDSKLYYTVYTSGSYYIYSFDGSTVSSVKNFGSDWLSYFTVYNSKLYFSQGSGSTYTLYSYDGTSFSSGTTLSGSVNRMVVFDSKLYMVLYKYSSGTSSYAIWSYDGSTLTNVVTLGSSYPEGFVGVDSKLYYSVYSSSGSSYGYDLYSLDGSTTSRVATLSNYPGNFTVYKGRLIFAVWDNTNNDYILKEYDGTAVNNLASSSNPPSKVADLITSDSGTWLQGFTEMNGVLYWMKGYNALWKYELLTIAFSSDPYASNISTTTLDLFVNTNMDGTAYYVVLSDGVSAPSSAQVKARTDASGTAVSLAGNSTVTANVGVTFSVSGLTTGTTYDIYVVAEDKSSNIQSSAFKFNVTTSAITVGTFVSGYPNVTVESDGIEGITATLKVKSGTDAIIYYVVLADGATTPTANDVKSGTGYGGVSVFASGSESITSDHEESLSITGLTASMDYDLYAVLGLFDDTGNETLQSSATRVDISTDVTAPSFATDYPSVYNITLTGLTVKMKVDESGTGYYVVLADGATAPTSTEVKALTGSAGATAVKSGSFTLAKDVENSESVTGLTAGTSYDVYSAVTDGNSNLQNSPTKVDATTLAKPTKLTVKQDGSGNYSTISAAITAASSTTTDTIVVYDGTYTENISFGGKDIIVKSNGGPTKTTITPSNNGLAIVWFYSGESSKSRLVGFTLTGGGALQGSALNIETNSSPTIENCIITNSKGYPLRFQNSSSIIKNCLIHSNVGDGIFYFDRFTSTTYPEIVNCTIADNTGYGIQNSKSYRPKIKNCIFHGNSSGGAFGNMDLTYSVVQGSYIGTGNKDQAPLFKKSTSTDYTLSDYSPAIGAATSTGAPPTDLTGATRGSPPDMGAYENSLSTPLSDTDAPVVSHVREGLTGDLAFIGTTTQMSAHWNGSDAGSGITKYEYAVDTDAANITGSVVGWTSAGTDTSVTITTGLAMAEGTTYYVSVRATDVVGNVSAVVTSNGVQSDITAPTVGTVIHGTTDFIRWTSDSASVTATWSGFSDGGSGIKEYEVLLKDSLNNSNVADWTNVGAVLTSTFSGLTLANNGLYYLKVRASDHVGNLSQTAVSADFQVDTQKPLITSLIETVDDLENDIDWAGPDMDIIHRWSGEDNGPLLQYEFSVGTGDGAADIIPWTNVGLDTTDTTSFEDYEEGEIYFTNVQAKDYAENLSDVVASDGFEIDATPPETGTVNDGTSADITYSELADELSCNWSGFSDNGSGIGHYVVAVGTSPQGTDIRQPADVGNVTDVIFTGLSLQHGVTYYSTVVAIDRVGNPSDPVSSNGFTVDVFPGVPQVSSVSPLLDSFLALTADSKVVFRFSEPLASSRFDVVSSLGQELKIEKSGDADSLVLILKAPLMSLDTVTVFLEDLTDLSGRVGDDSEYTFYASLLADYNNDLAVDAQDLTTFVNDWMSGDLSSELGPVEGEAPYFTPQVDGEYNLRDVMAFTRMWHWYQGTPRLLNLALEALGTQLHVSVLDNSVSMTVPEGVVAGRIVFQLSCSDCDLFLPAAEATGEIVVLSHKDNITRQSVVDFGYLKDRRERELSFRVDSGTSAVTLSFAYTLYSGGGSITHQGTRIIDITPIPLEYVVYQNYPNPFNPTTQIQFGLPDESKIWLTVYDVLGRQVRSLISSSMEEAGFHSVRWDARDDAGTPVSAGLYFYQLTARGVNGATFSKTSKMLLLK